MAIAVPTTASFNWLLQAATKLEKACYRKINYKYRVKLKDLNNENDQLLLKCEVMIPALQEEIQRLKVELEAKDKLCAQLKVDLEMTRRIALKGSNESDEWLGNSTDSNENIDEDPNENIDEEETEDNEKPVEPSNDKKTIENADKKTIENADKKSVENAEMDEKTVDKIIVSKKTVDELKTDTGKTVEDTNHPSKPAIVEIGIGIKTPNDLIQLPTPLILTNLDPQAHQPPSSPKKRTRSLSPQSSVLNLTNDSSPLAPPEMIETPTGPGQGVKRKKRKKK